jgi:hypothetical protein
VCTDCDGGATTTVTPKSAKLAERVDRDRAAFIKRYFNLEWPAIHRFHLMINSSIGDGVAAETILEAAARYGEKRQ